MQNNSNQNEQLNCLTGKIIEFQQKLSVIELEDGQKIFWPIKKLNDQAQIGQEIKLVLTTNQDEQKEKENLAKTIVNQILKKD